MSCFIDCYARLNLITLNEPSYDLCITNGYLGALSKVIPWLTGIIAEYVYMSNSCLHSAQICKRLYIKNELLRTAWYLKST